MASTALAQLHGRLRFGALRLGSAQAMMAAWPDSVDFRIFGGSGASATSRA
jgi:hypothetical protein